MWAVIVYAADMATITDHGKIAAVSLLERVSLEDKHAGIERRLAFNRQPLDIVCALRRRGPSNHGADRVYWMPAFAGMTGGRGGASSPLPASGER
jgi:hypothetical protein